MTRKELYSQVLAYFEEKMPTADTELEFTSNFQLIVAVILSAQCTDKRVNMVTPALFSALPSAKAMADSSIDEIFEYVKSVSYPNSKAKHLYEMANLLVERHNGEVPSTMEELMALPGVGRKTANVVQAVAFGRSTLAVDTHVFRVSHRLGLVAKSADTPFKVEKELTRHIPTELIPRAHHWLLLHGRYVCTSRNPKCEGCDLNHLCKDYLTRKPSPTRI